MDALYLSLLFTVLLSSVNSVISSYAQNPNLSRRNITGLIQSSVQNTNSKSLWYSKLLPDQITSKKSYAKGKKNGPNRFNQLNKKMRKWLEKKEEKPSFNPDFVIISDPPTPIYVQTFPANGSIPDDGCDSNSIRFDDGKCYPLMTREPCGDPRQWVTVDPVTFKGRCTPRLCGRDRVFVVRTGLCHDIYDRSECQGGRRLYYSPYGDPVCDCPIGEYPYPNPRDDCYPLFTRGPCPYGQVLTMDSDDRLSCTLSLCPAEKPSTSYPINDVYSPLTKSLLTYGDNYEYQKRPKQLVPTDDGKCLELGTSGQCSGSSDYYDDSSQLLGFDILSRKLECVDISDPWSPYHSSPSENQLLDSVYNQFYPEYDFFPIWLVYNSIQHENQVKYKDDKKKKKKKTSGFYKRSNMSRQFSGTGINVPDNPPCRPGSGQGKCTSKLVPSQQSRPTRQAVKPGRQTNCSGNQVFNPATGGCQNRSG